MIMPWVKMGLSPDWLGTTDRSCLSPTSLFLVWPVPMSMTTAHKALYLSTGLVPITSQSLAWAGRLGHRSDHQYHGGDITHGIGIWFPFPLEDL